MQLERELLLLLDLTCLLAWVAECVASRSAHNLPWRIGGGALGVIMAGNLALVGAQPKLPAASAGMVITGHKQWNSLWRIELQGTPRVPKPH